MLNPRNYTDKQIHDALRMKKGSRQVSFRYDLLNRHDIKIGELDGITGMISYGEFRVIKRSATFSLDEYLQRNINYMSDQVQPWFILHMPDGGTVEWPLGIFLLESPNREITGRVSNREISAFDKTIIIEEDKFTESYFIASGTNYVGAITKILTTAGITKINIVGSDLTLRADKEYSVGVKKKEAINELLKEMNYNSIRADELGQMRSEPYVEPSQRPITQTYIADENSIILPEFTERLEIAGRANVFTRVARNLDSETELVSTFINDDPLSSISTVSRGRQIVDFTEIESIPNQETLDNLVRRVAIEGTSAYSHLSFGTALMPTHGSADTIYIDLSARKVDKVYTDIFPIPMRFSETSWEMELKHNGIMQHEARKVVQL